MLRVFVGRAHERQCMRHPRQSVTADVTGCHLAARLALSHLPMRRDQQLVEAFVRGYNRSRGESYQIAQRPEDVERHKPTVEAIFRDGAGKTLAVEHTLIQPFVGQKDDDQPFLTAIAPLEMNPSLRLPAYEILLYPPVGAIPKGPDWNDVCRNITHWLQNEKDRLPDGLSQHQVEVGEFSLELLAEKTPGPYPEGRVAVGRSRLPDSFQDVVRTALERKLPKLVAAGCDKRILLLEMETGVHSPGDVTDAITSLQRDFRDLAKTDEVWCVLTMGWEREGTLQFYQVWPPSRAQRPKFNVQCPPMRKP